MMPTLSLTFARPVAPPEPQYHPQPREHGHSHYEWMRRTQNERMFYFKLIVAWAQFRAALHKPEYEDIENTYAYFLAET